MLDFATHPSSHPFLSRLSIRSLRELMGGLRRILAYLFLVYRSHVGSHARTRARDACRYARTRINMPIMPPVANPSGGTLAFGGCELDSTPVDATRQGADNGWAMHHLDSHSYAIWTDHERANLVSICAIQLI